MPWVPPPLEYDLTDHASPSVQPHGALLAFDDAGTIVHAAGDTRRLLGVKPESLLGRQATGLAWASVGHWIGSALERASACAGYLGTWTPPSPGTGCWDVTAHRAGGYMVLEFEPAPPTRQSAAEGLADLGRALAALDASVDLTGVCAAAAREIGRLTGFDRVLICRASDDGAGLVIAEDGNGCLPALTSPHLDPCELAQQPPTHGVQQTHFVGDVQAMPAPLLGASGTPALDTSRCHLRGASMARLRQLRELGAVAAMSLPLVIGGRLWGSIECHHHAARLLSCEMREACGQLGRVLSQQIARHEDDAHRREAARLRGRRIELLSRLHAPGADAPGPDLQTLAAAIPADGFALVSRGQATLAGRAPGERQVLELVEWLGPELERGVYATDRLGECFAPATPYAATASGVLAATTVGEAPSILLWFRAAHREMTEGSGLEDATAAPARERGRCRAWTKAQLDAARQLTKALGELAQQQTLRELNARLREALAEQQSLVAEKNLLLQEVHHRMQNGLQIVNSMLQLQARQTAEPQVRAQFDSAVTRLLAIGAVHRHLWQSGEAEHVQLGRYLKQLCDDLMRSWGDEWSGRLTVAAPEVALPSQTAVTLALVVTELLTNAVKYAYGGTAGPIAVHVETRGAQLRATVSDQGRGIPHASVGDGLGSKLIRVFTAQLDGEVETTSSESGTSVTVRIPLPSCAADACIAAAVDSPGSTLGPDAAHAA